MTTDTDQTQSGDQERDETQLPVVDETAEKEERALLMQRARMMNLTISNNIGLETLRKRIKEAMEGGEKTSTVATPELVDPAERVVAGRSPRQKRRDEALKLIRCQITNLDPKKKDLPGEIITVGNDDIGTIRKFIPFGESTENGYHIPNIIYNLLKRRKFLNIRTRKGPKGEILTEQNWAQEFSITVLEPLTKQQLKELAIAQTAAGSVS